MNPDCKLDLDLDVELTEFDLPEPIPGFALDFAEDAAAIGTETLMIRRYPRPRPALVRYERAVDLVRALPDLEPGATVHAIVSGNFIFGDFLEAFLVEKNLHADEMLIATLSLGQENVDSLVNLVKGGYLGRLGLITSDYWYAHERRKAGGVPYIMRHLGNWELFSFAAAGVHTKVTLIRAADAYLVLHGSANLRSSRNLEQFCIDNCPALYNFHRTWMEKIIQSFSPKNPTQRGDELWQTLQGPQKKAD
jgi:hypothetical protein